MTNDGHHRKSEHDEADMAMPAVPGATFVVVEAELVLGGFKTVFDGPAVALHRHQLFDRCANWTPCGEEGEIAVGDLAADQQPPRPDARGMPRRNHRRRDRPIRDRPNHAAVRLWCHHLPTGVA